MLEVEHTGQRATTQSPAPLLKHSPGGCTIDVPLSNYYQQWGYALSCSVNLDKVWLLWPPRYGTSRQFQDNMAIS